jgi:predicted nicotinamide N-methyase
MPGYKTKQESIAIAGADDLIIRSLLDRQQFHDPHGDAEQLGISSAAWPIFGLLWPSGAQLAARMAARIVSPTERVLEMGCGLALASLVAHRRGADVTASDCHPLAGEFLKANLLLNHLLPMKYRQGQWDDSVSPKVRDGIVPIQRMSGEYDLLIGSDLLYERDDAGFLSHFVSRHAAPCAEVWIVDPNRSNRRAFNGRMAASGFVLTEETICTMATDRDPAYNGRLLTYMRD